METQAKRTPGKPIKRIQVQLGISRELYERMRKHAAGEGLPFAAWLRVLALRELRRAKSAD